jgi:putative phosphoribosyl transferase
VSLYRDRHDAGRTLAAQLSRYAGRGDVKVFALPRGGVPVGYEVARALGAPLDVFVVRKLGLPGNEELAIGAIAPGGVRVLDGDLLSAVDVSEAEIAAVVDREQRELARREHDYRGGRPLPDVKDGIAIVVDDGLATGATMRAAVLGLRRLSPARVVVAAPVGSQATCRALAAEADEVVCAAAPEPFDAVGLWYDDFAQTTDDEVRRLLEEAARPTA